MSRPVVRSTVIEEEALTHFEARVDVSHLTETRARFEWAAANIGSPAVAGVIIADDLAMFEFVPVNGTPADRPEHQFELNTTLRLVGECARRLHDQPVGDCPPALSLLERAQAMVARMANDDRSLDPPYHRVTRQRLAQVVLDGVPEAPVDPVVCHGHLNLANIVIADGKHATLAPPIGLTVADRHLDIATLVRSLSHAGPGELIAATIESYGWGGVAAPRLDWFDMLAALESLDPEADDEADEASGESSAAPAAPQP